MTPETLHTQFDRLVWAYVRRWQRSRGLDDSIAEDLHSMVWMEIMKVPERYHNGAGMRVVIQSKLRRYMKAKVPFQPKELTGMIEQPYEETTAADGTLEDKEDWWSGHRVEPATTNGYHHVENEFDFSKIQQFIPLLPSTERCVLELLYGLNGTQLCHPTLTARKLGKSINWVRAHHELAIKKLRELIGVSDGLLQTRG